jgi:hypothetical protein
MGRLFGMGRRELACVQLVLVARLARCASGVLCGLGHALCVVGGLGLFVSVFARFLPKKPDTFCLINRLGQCLLPPFQKKKPYFLLYLTYKTISSFIKYFQNIFSNKNRKCD